MLIKTKHFNIVREEYENYNSFIKTLENRSYNNWASHKARSDEADIDANWCGVNSFDEAKEKLINGWIDELKDMNKEVQSIDKKYQQGKSVKTIQDVAGFAPIVPNALLCLPNSMFNTRINVKKQKVLKVYIDGDVSCCISSREKMEYFSKVFAYLVALEKQGYRVNINVSFNFGKSYEKELHTLVVNIKKENQPIDLAKMMFPAIHTGMFRMLSFDWYESLPNATYISGYGRALRDWVDSSRVQEVLDTFEKNAVYISFRDDFKSKFQAKGVK